MSPGEAPTSRVLLLADTHLGPGDGSRLTTRIGKHLAAVDAVVHAGDISDASVLEAVRACAPHVELHAVAGNADHGLALPERLVIELGGCTVAVVHDSGRASGRATRLRRRFPDADLVVFGHSHLPSHEVDVRPGDGHRQHQVNPGSAILRRRAPICTVARALLVDGVVAHVRHVDVAY